MLLRSKRHCAECRATIRVDKHDANRPYVYCSSGCQANGWRRVHRLQPILQWYGQNISYTPAAVLAATPSTPEPSTPAGG